MEKDSIVRINSWRYAKNDATNSNNSNRISRFFKDLDLDFGLNSVTKDVNKLTDVENAIKRSVRNLINLNNYEKDFQRLVQVD